MRTTKSMLLNRLKHLADLCNVPASASAAKEQEKGEYLALDHQPLYGGYSIVLVHLPDYSERCPFGNDRLSASEMFAKINNIINGMYTDRRIAAGETL